MYSHSGKAANMRLGMVQSTAVSFTPSQTSART